MTWKDTPGLASWRTCSGTMLMPSPAATMVSTVDICLGVVAMTGESHELNTLQRHDRTTQLLHSRGMGSELSSPGVLDDHRPSAEKSDQYTYDPLAPKTFFKYCRLAHASGKDS